MARILSSIARPKRIVLALILLCAPAMNLGAQSALTPRLLTPAPVGVNFASVSYLYTSGNIVLDATLPLEDTKARVHAIALAYVRSLDLFGQSGRLTVGVPLAHGTWSGDVQGVNTTTTRNGVGDPLVGLGIGFLGAPAMTAREMVGYRPHIVLGTAIFVRIPVGQYDNTKLFNLGTNRWQAALGVGGALYTGRWEFELQARGWFSTTNNDALGGLSLGQRPLVGFQVHGAYTFKRGLWVAVSVGQSFGGAGVVNGVVRDNAQANNRAAAAIVVPLHGAWSLKAGYTVGVATRYGGDFDIGAVSLSYHWGGGL